MDRLLIFDCDGVLVDSEILSNQAGVEVLAELGIQLTLQEHIEKFVGKSAADVAAEIEKVLGHPLPDGYPQRKADHTEQLFARELQAIAGIHEALDTLQMPHCLASGSHRKRIDQSLQLTGLQSHFEGRIFTIEQVERGKPAPDLFLLAAQTLGYAPEQCVVIEDSVSGVQAAVRAGMVPLGFVGGSHCGPRQAAQLLEAGARLVFRDMALLPELLQGYRMPLVR